MSLKSKNNEINIQNAICALGKQTYNEPVFTGIQGLYNRCDGKKKLVMYFYGKHAAVGHNWIFIRYI